MNKSRWKTCYNFYRHDQSLENACKQLPQLLRIFALGSSTFLLSDHTHQGIIYFARQFCSAKSKLISNLVQLHRNLFRPRCDDSSFEHKAELSHGRARVHLDRFQANESNDYFPPSPVYTRRGHITFKSFNLSTRIGTVA